MSMRLIAIEGEEQLFDDSPSFMRKFGDGRSWVGPDESIYVNGTTPRRNAEIAAANAAGVDTVFLAGYGHGGAAAIAAAEILKKAGRKVDRLLLFDAVSLRSGLGEPAIPENVAVTVHGRRHPATLSRPDLGSCGLRSPGEYREQTFWVTHRGASGRSCLLGPPLRGDDQFVKEGNRNTLVTRGQDYEGGIRLWEWMKARLYDAVFEAVQRDPASAPGVRYHKV